MQAFDFIMLFFSLIYPLALTHLLLAVNAIIRYRRKIQFSAPQAIWMFDVLLAVSINWISLWDFHEVLEISLEAIARARYRRRARGWQICYGQTNAATVNPEQRRAITTGRTSIRASATRHGSSARSRRSSTPLRSLRSRRRRAYRSRRARAYGAARGYRIRGIGAACSRYSRPRIKLSIVGP